MRTGLANFLRPATEVNPARAICLFFLLQFYFATNILSFGFWKSSDNVFAHMLVFYGAWIAGLVVALSVTLVAGRRFDRSWLVIALPVVLSTPFAWVLWPQTIEIDDSGLRNVVRIALVPVMYLYFRIGFENVRWTACAVLVLCILSFAGHAGFPGSIGKSRDFNVIVMDRKPNVHVIVLDSFTHSRFAEEFIGVENPAADYLESLDDTIYAGSMGFAENVPTKRFWGTLFNLGESTHVPGFFSGAAPSRLTALLRRNGYHISTGFSGDYFGWYKGEHVDRYYRGSTQRLEHSLVCTSHMGRLGFCSDFSRSEFLRLFVKGAKDEFGRTQAAAMREWPETVVDLIDRAERNETAPLFSAFYMYWPIGHTSLSYRSGDAEMFEEYKPYFVKGVRRARGVLENIDRLRKRYPESIFIVAGDHGPYLSRGAPEEERRFIVLDRHGVALALLNASNLCEWSRNWLARQRYLTPSRMLAAALACNGESRRLTQGLTDNEDFIRFGESFAKERS